MINVSSCSTYSILITLISLLFAAYTLWLRKQDYKKNTPNFIIEPLFDFSKNTEDIKPIVKLKIINKSRINGNLDKVIIYYYKNAIIRFIYKFFCFKAGLNQHEIDISKKCNALDSIIVSLETNSNAKYYNICKIEIIDKVSEVWKVKWYQSKTIKKLTYVEELKKYNTKYGINYLYKLGKNYRANVFVGENKKSTKEDRKYKLALDFFNKYSL